MFSGIFGEVDVGADGEVPVGRGGIFKWDGNVFEDEETRVGGDGGLDVEEAMRGALDRSLPLGVGSVAHAENWVVLVGFVMLVCYDGVWWMLSWFSSGVEAKVEFTIVITS